MAEGLTHRWYMWLQALTHTHRWYRFIIRQARTYGRKVDRPPLTVRAWRGVRD